MHPAPAPPPGPRPARASGYPTGSEQCWRPMTHVAASQRGSGMCGDMCAGGRGAVARVGRATLRHSRELIHQGKAAYTESGARALIATSSHSQSHSLTDRSLCPSLPSICHVWHVAKGNETV